MMRRPALFSLPFLFTALITAGCAAPPEDLESDDIGEAEQAQVVCAADQTVPGIDVSVWQQSVNWDAVASSGIKFAFARASYGTSKDTYFDENWANMKAAGLIRGAYQYWLPAKDPIEQAQAMLDIMGPMEPGDLPPVVDVEQTDGLGPTELSNRLAIWIDHVEKTIGRKPIIYSGKYFWQDNVKSYDFLDYPLWIPNYSLDCPDLPTGYWDNWHFFQYTSTGSVNGVSGNVDRNDFNGTLEELYAFADGGPVFGAKFVSQSFPYASQGPVYMLAGQSVEVSLEMLNTGTEPWDENTYLGTTEPRDRESPFAGKEWPAPNRYARVSGVVMPGETYTFTWKMHAPLKEGLYDEHIGLVQEGVAWFGDPGHAGPPDEQLEGLFEVSALESLVPYAEGTTPDDVKDDKNPTASAGCSASGSVGCSVGDFGETPQRGTLLWVLIGAGALITRRRSRPA